MVSHVFSDQQLLAVHHDSQMCEELLVPPKVLKRSHFIKSWSDQTHQFLVTLS